MELLYIYIRVEGCGASVNIYFYFWDKLSAVHARYAKDTLKT